MKNLWNDGEAEKLVADYAKKGVSRDLALRVYTTRLLGGEPRLVLHGGRAVVSGRRSDSSLYDYRLATYDAPDTFDQSLARGFVELWGLPSKMAAVRSRRLQGETGG